MVLPSTVQNLLFRRFASDCPASCIFMFPLFLPIQLTMDIIVKDSEKKKYDSDKEHSKVNV